MIHIKIVPKYKPPKAKLVKAKPRKEFSKKALAAMIVLWFIGALTCIFVVLVQVMRGDMTVNTSDLTMCICTPMTGGVLGYMLKSAAENREKIKGGSQPQEGNTYEHT